MERPTTRVLTVLELLQTHDRLSGTLLADLEECADTVRLLAQTDDLDWFARQLGRLPFDFTVIRPAALREAVKRGGRRMERLGKRRGRER